MKPQDATTLYDYYKAIGQSLPPVATRADVYKSLGLGSAYSGTADQNNALLGKLKELSVGSTPAAPAASTPGTPAAPTTPTTPTDTRTLPGLPTLPQEDERTLGTTAVAPRTLPTQNSSGLMAFSEKLSSAVQLARNKRNELVTQFIGTVPAGTMPYGDFAPIVSNLNNASDSTANNLINTAVSIADRDTQRNSTNDANNLSAIREITLKAIEGGAPDAILQKMYEAQDPVQAAAIGAKYLKNTTSGAGATSGQLLNPDGSVAQDNVTLPKPYTSGTLTVDGNAQLEVYNILRTGKTNSGTQYGNAAGADNFVDPAVYLKLMDNWKAGGGQVSDFISKWPPKDYINPANNWVGAELVKRGVSWSPAKVPSSGGSGGSSSGGRTI